MAYINIAQISLTDNLSLCLQAHLAPSCDCKEGFGCAFFLCHKTPRCSSPPSLPRVQLFSDDPLGLFHQAGERTCCFEPARVVASAPCHWHSQRRDALERVLQMKRPVCRNSAARPPRTQEQHCFSTYEPPACPGHCHAILDQRLAGHFDPPDRHRTTRGEIGIAMQAVGILAQGMRPQRAAGTLGFWRAGRRGNAPETRGRQWVAAVPRLRKACAHPQI
jgi:hypothetical protein